jgi:hypothetical protein
VIGVGQRSDGVHDRRIAGGEAAAADEGGGDGAGRGELDGAATADAPVHWQLHFRSSAELYRWVTNLEIRGIAPRLCAVPPAAISRALDLIAIGRGVPTLAAALLAVALFGEEFVEALDNPSCALRDGRFAASSASG